MKLKRDSDVRALLSLCLCCILAVIFSSCATHRDVVEIREELERLSITSESRFSSLEYSVALLDSLAREQHALSLSIRALIGSQDQTRAEELATLSARQDEINYQLQELLSKLQAIQLYGGLPEQQSAPQASSASQTKPPSSRMESGATPPPPADPSSALTIQVKPEDIYKSAVEDINRGNYALAESRLLTFLIQFPEHELAGNAQYWLAEAAYGQENWKLAVTEVEKLIKKYKKSSKLPAGYLLKGMAEIQIGHKISARTSFNRLIKSFPNSEEAARAKELLETL